LVALVATLGGCSLNPYSRSVALQVSRGSASASADGRAPVVGAEVVVEAADGTARSLGRTDQEGRVGEAPVEPVRLDSTIKIVDATNAVRIPVVDACAVRSGDECRVLDARVRLKDAAAGVAADARH
jgi:hypothetical protein